MDLFTKEEKIKGLHAQVARMFVELHNKHLDQENTMYPFNHILVDAMHGKTELIKPTQGLSPKKANILKKLGYNVNYNMEKGLWTISWA